VSLLLYPDVMICLSINRSLIKEGDKKGPRLLAFYFLGNGKEENAIFKY